MIIAHRFTCGERKFWQNIKKTQNVMKMIVDLVVQQLCYINCLNTWATNCATFRNQKLCCGTVFLN